jgi:hypothetical protein
MPSNDRTGNWTIHEAAQQALRELKQPTHLRELRRYIEKQGYFTFGAKDPERALGVQLDRHSKGVQISHAASPQLFFRARPATYGLLEWLSGSELEDLQTDEQISTSIENDELDSSLILETELHQWLHKNLHDNGLTALGYGRLEEWDPERQGESLGKFRTGVVGEIDMLLRTPDGDVVVLELKRRSDDQTVGQICRYYGWVKEELCPPDKRVFGLILTKEVSDSMRYALKAVASEIRVRQLQFEVRLGAPWP